MHGTILMVTDGDDRYTPCTSDDVWEYIGNNMYYDGIDYISDFEETDLAELTEGLFRPIGMDTEGCKVIFREDEYNRIFDRNLEDNSDIKNSFHRMRMAILDKYYNPVILYDDGDMVYYHDIPTFLYCHGMRDGQEFTVRQVFDYHF